MAPSTGHHGTLFCVTLSNWSAALSNQQLLLLKPASVLSQDYRQGLPPSSETSERLLETPTTHKLNGRKEKQAMAVDAENLTALVDSQESILLFT